MKKSTKAIIIVLAIIVAAALTVGGLTLGGVISFGDKTKAEAGEVVQDEFLYNTYKNNKPVYEWSLKQLYGLGDDDVADFYADDQNAWKVYTQQVNITNGREGALVVLNPQTQNNGTGSVWIRTIAELAELSISEDGTGEFTVTIIAKGYENPSDVLDAVKELAPTLVCVLNTNENPDEDFDSSAAEKFDLEISF